jgi:hypothetical protein
MKARLATPIKKVIVVVLKTNNERITLEEFDINVSSDEIALKYSWNILKEKYPDMIAICTDKIYDTPSGQLEPGCLFWNDWYPETMYWDNQKGPHLMAILPNGNHWCIDSRASNCTLPLDRTHRCWCRHGELPNITVNKVGETCSAGAGSIQSGTYHGFLINGEFTE